MESGERASDLELQSASTSATVTTEQVRVFVIFHRFQEKSPLRNYSNEHPKFSGTNCELNPCSDRPCQNGGKCKWAPLKPNTYGCECPDGYKGKNCQCKLFLVAHGLSYFEVSPCDLNKKACKNHAQCEVVGSSFKCNCADGSSGDYCEHNICEQSEFACQNSGICVWHPKLGWGFSKFIVSYFRSIREHN